jgi:hypothetical protein
MARKKPPLSLRRPGDVVDPQRAEHFVRGLTPAAPVEAPAPAVVPPDVEASRRPDVQAPAVSGSKALVYRKRTDDHRRRMTIYLPEDLSRRLRLYAAQHDQDYSVVLAEALDALLARKGVR